MKPGTLYLIPATLGDLKANGAEGAPALLDWSLPAQVRAVAARLTCFGVENAKLMYPRCVTIEDKEFHPVKTLKRG